MKYDTENIDTLKNQLLNETIFWIGVIFTPGVIISLSRVFVIGWVPLMGIHLMLFAAIWLLWFMRRQLAYQTRVLWSLAFMWTASIAGLVQLGPVGLVGILTVLGAFIAVLFLEGRLAWWLIAGNILSLIIVGIAASLHWLEFNLNYAIYVYHPLTWVHTIWTLSAYSLVVALAGWRLINWLGDRDKILSQATKQLSESEQHYRTLADGGTVLIWTADVDKLCNYFNEPWLNFTGRTMEQEYGNGWAEGVHPEDFDDCLAIYVTAFDKRQVFSMEYRLRYNDGSYRWILDEGNPRYDSQGQFLGYIGFCYDITPQKELRDKLTAHQHQLEQLVAERTTELENTLEQLKVGEERLSYALDATNDGIWDWDIITNACYTNAAYLRMLGYELDEFPNDAKKRWVDLLHPDEREAVLAKTAGLLENDDGSEVEFRMRAKDGSYKWILSRRKVVERDEKGKAVRAIGTHTDLTARKQFEIQLKAAKDAAEMASLAKSSFLANMSHEIRTPMNAILGFSHSLALDLIEPDQRHKLDKISLSAKHLLNIINDILDLSKIEADQLQLEATPFNVVTLVNQVHGMMSERFQQKNLTLLEDVDPRLAIGGVIGDSLRVSQMLINYLGNAVKFTDHGWVTLRVKLEAEQGDKVIIRFEVQDTGIGISEVQQLRLFENFEQAEASITRKYGGTGLGLAINRRLAHLMGGDTGVVSLEGQGSTFWFTVCLKRCSELEHEDDLMKPEAQIRMGACILLVEDNEINQEIACMLLESKGLSVDIANHGGEALLMVKANTYDLILMDMQMPVMDGLEATRCIRQLDCGQSIPIVAMTANAFEDDQRNCIEAGMNSFLAKPIDPDVLYRELAHWLPQKN